MNPKNQVLTDAGGIPSEEAFGGSEVWQYGHFAKEWYKEAREEAGRTDIAPLITRRREVLFAVCAAEAYLLEWVRDVVLKFDFHKLGKYFPPDDRRRVDDKWKEVPKCLKKDNLITDVPDLGTGKLWRSFSEELVPYRNGVVHASISRPDGGTGSQTKRPYPPPHILASLPAGWASDVVRDLILELNTAAGTEPPSWL